VDGVDASGLDALLARTMAAVERVGAVAGDGSEPVEGEGTALDGQVSVRALPPGRLGAVLLDPRVMRLPSQDLAEALVVAANAALADLQEKAALPAGAPDLTGLRSSLDQLRQDANRQFGALTASLLAAQDRVVASAAATGTGEEG
jgi:hypothetical protein